MEFRFRLTLGKDWESLRTRPIINVLDDRLVDDVLVRPDAVGWRHCVNMVRHLPSVQLIFLSLHRQLRSLAQQRRLEPLLFNRELNGCGRKPTCLVRSKSCLLVISIVKSLLEQLQLLFEVLWFEIKTRLHYFVVDLAWADSWWLRPTFEMACRELRELKWGLVLVKQRSRSTACLGDDWSSRALS